MPEPEAQRRLTTIVAIDVVGYSAMTKADEAGAAAQVAALAKRIAAACARHGGRVFNTAGDGFMLEFPAVSGALEAADLLAAAGRPPIRVGVHLGEVLVTPTGDLLGHGVNVAARIQSMAPSGGVLVSADVQRAIRGPLAGRLVARGTVRLDKMDEAVAVFALQRPGESAGKPVRRAPNVLPWLAAFAVMVVLTGGSAWLSRERLWPAPVDPNPKVAVLPFTVLSTDPDARYFASGLSDEITGVMTSAQMLSVPAGETAALRGPNAAAALARLGAAFVLDGSVERDGDAFRVRLRLMNARDQVTLWSDVFSGSTANPAALQVQVAAAATDVMGWALLNRRSSGGAALDDATQAAMLQANSLTALGGPQMAQKARMIFSSVVIRAPKFSRGHSNMAIMDGVAALQSPPEEAAALRRETRAEALKALALDPRNGEAYLALNLATESTRWGERERLLTQGLALEPDFPYLNNNYSYLLGAQGRTREAIAAGERGLALNALHPGANFKYAEHLSQSGRYDAAREAIDLTVRRWPKAWTDLARLSIVMTAGPVADAQAVLDQSSAHPFDGEAPTLAIWRAFLEARRSGGAAAKGRAASAIAAGVAAYKFKREDAILALSVLGDVDAAFAQADHDYDGLANGSTGLLFAPATAPMRRDPRFWPLTTKLGLTQYWLASNHWPDVCAPAGDLRDCKASATAAVAAQAASARP